MLGSILKSCKHWATSRNKTAWVTHLLVLTSTIVFYLGYHPLFGWPTLNTETWYTLITHLFSHGSSNHLFGNMMFLMLTGPYVEAQVGKLRTLILYLGCGIGASMLFSYTNPYELSLGASGAIAGFMAVYIIKQRSMLGFCMAFMFIGSLFERDLYLVIHPELAGGVANLAHLGGAVTGILMITWYKIWQPFK